MNTKLFLGLSLVVLLLSGCAAATDQPADSGIEGKVLIGPLCPVVRPGEECPDEPYQATLTVNDLNGNKVTQVQSDENGQFKIPLAPGDYILHPETPNGIPSAQEQPVSVTAGTFTEVVVNYDSGIR